MSRVINGEAAVRPETRARVEAAIARLAFRPSLAARAMAGARSFQIALVYDNPSPHYLHHLQDGALARCEAAGRRLVIQPLRRESPSLATQVERLIAETGIDGIILSLPLCEIEEVLAAIERRRVPMVRIAPGHAPGRTASVSIDDDAAAAAMTGHLAALGHRRIGFVIGNPHHVASRQRHTGYRRALTAHGLTFDPGLEAQGAFSFESGLTAAAALLDRPDPPTAIFASNDDMAAGVLAAAHHRGIAVPARLSVAGFDDTGIAPLVWPPLTTVHQPIRDMAFAAADLLLGDAPPGTAVRLEHRLVLRRSTAPPGWPKAPMTE